MITPAAIDYAVDVIAREQPDLPMTGRVWVLRIEDDEIVLRIRTEAQRRVNGEPVPNREIPRDPKPKDPPPKDPPPKEGK